MCRMWYICVCVWYDKNSSRCVWYNSVCSVVGEKFSALCVVCVEPESPAEAESDPLAAQCVVHSVW